MAENHLFYGDNLDVQRGSFVEDPIMLDDAFRFAEQMRVEAAKIQRQFQPALDQFREATAQIAAYERALPAGLTEQLQLQAIRDFNKSLPAGLIDQMREGIAFAERMRSVSPDIEARNSAWLGALPPSQRDEIQRLHDKIDRLSNPPDDDEDSPPMPRIGF